VGSLWIDFNLQTLSPALRTELETKANAVLACDYVLECYSLPEAQFRERGGLLRTLEAKPPVRDGHVRVVAIRGFDEQACGGTHVRSTAEVGQFSIFRTEKKGRINQRLYIVLAPPSQPAPAQRLHAPG
jgi:misacylated tRNA(Ala) deacylase